MRTFKQLQDDALRWQADQDDTNLMRALVKDAIREAHRALLTEQMYDFMLWPQQETLEIVPGRKVYALNPLFMQGLWFYEADKRRWWTEVPVKGQYEFYENPVDENGDGEHFMITSTSPVRRQPEGGSQITVTTTGGDESAANSIVLEGLDTNGDFIAEQLTSGSAWNTLASTNTFETLTGVTKVGETWTKTLTFTDSEANTLLELRASEWGKQYRMFELISTPQTATTLHYRFYQKPKALVEDNALVQIPEEFDQILVYRALLALQGYNRATAKETEYWMENLQKLELNLKATYTQARTLGSRANYIHYKERY